MNTMIPQAAQPRTTLAVAVSGAGDDLADLLPVACENSSYHWDGDVAATAVISYDLVNCLGDHHEARMLVCDECALPALRQIRSHHGTPFCAPVLSDLPTRTAVAA